MSKIEMPLTGSDTPTQQAQGNYGLTVGRPIGRLRAREDMHVAAQGDHDVPGSFLPVLGDIHGTVPASHYIFSRGQARRRRNIQSRATHLDVRLLPR